MISAAGRRATRAVTFLVALCSASPASTQTNALTPDDIDSLEVYLVAALAAPDETAYLQILTDALILPDRTDSNSVYDIVVRYDPERFHTPYAGLYPLTFEDQFIQWGKRIALFTRSISPATKRFYLHDISTGDQAWMFTAEARHLYSLPANKVPGLAGISDRAAQASWLRLIHTTPAGTQLLTMSGWLRQIRRESRASVVERIGAHQLTPATPTGAP